MEQYLEQHPIPQQISSYEFRLVGDMTIKQFFQVAGGALAALFFYSGNLPSYFKVPLIIFSILLGLALAFFPLQDRPLSQWILLFAKAIYSPTMFIWAKVPLPEYFQKDVPLAQTSQTITETARPDLKIPSTNVPKIPGHQEPEDKVMGTTPISKNEEKRSINRAIDQPAESARLEQKEEEFLSKVEQQFSTITINAETPTVLVAGPSEVDKKGRPVEIPHMANITVEKETKPTVVSSPGLGVTTTTGHQVTPIAQAKPVQTTTPQFSAEATPPAPPSSPNIIVGQIIDPLGKIVEGAILEIRDAEGRPVRALKTNKLGHFMIASPLTNGTYQLLAEKDNLMFDPVKMDVVGNVIQPIAIRARAN